MAIVYTPEEQERFRDLLREGQGIFFPGGVHVTSEDALEEYLEPLHGEKPAHRRTSRTGGQPSLKRKPEQEPEGESAPEEPEPLHGEKPAEE